MKKVKTKIESIGHTCSNPECERDFVNPIIVEDFSSKNRLSYQACPYCLTRVVEEAGKAEEKTRKEKRSKIKREETRTPEVIAVHPAQQLYAKETECPYYFGYLSQRSKKENIPEECMTCEKIVGCMLRKVTE